MGHTANHDAAESIREAGLLYFGHIMDEVDESGPDTHVDTDFLSG
jgi:hypothetical protein